MNRLIFPALVTTVIMGGGYLIFWTSSHGKLIESAALAFFLMCVFLSQARRYAQTQIRSYRVIVPDATDEPEI